MKKETRQTGRGRREFLRLAGLGTVVGTVAAVTGGPVAQAAETGTPGGGYRVTEHVKKVYDLARF